MNKAQLYRAVGDNNNAKAIYDQAIGIMKKLVDQEGRRELKGNLAMAQARRAVVLADLGDIEGAKAEAASAIPVLQAEFDRTGRADLQAVLKRTLDTLKNIP